MLTHIIHAQKPFEVLGKTYNAVELEYTKQIKPFSGELPKTYKQVGVFTEVPHSTQSSGNMSIKIYQTSRKSFRAMIHKKGVLDPYIYKCTLVTIYKYTTPNT